MYGRAMMAMAFPRSALLVKIDPVCGVGGTADFAGKMSALERF